jgi:hypothetical protein
MRLSKVFAAVAVLAASGASFAATTDLTSVGASGVTLSQVSLDAGNNYYGIGGLEYIVSGTNPASTFAAFCLEPTEHFFNVNPTTFNIGTLTAPKSDALSKLFTGAGWNGANYATDSVTTDAQKSALALAVWDIATDGALDFGAGTFRVQADSLTAQALVWYAAGNTSLSPYLVALTNDGIQDLVTAVPEPSTYALLLAGLAGIGFVARRRQPRA